MSIVETRGLTKLYKQGDTEIFGTKDINLKIEKGEFVAITGKSGSGKTTLLNMLGGMDKPTGGTVIIDGSDLFTTTDEQLAVVRRRKIGFIFQNFNLMPILTAKENIIMPCLLDGKKVDNNYLNEIAKMLDISDRLAHLPSELSGGQKQRVAIARALINHPSILLADEPTGNLDRKSADDLMALLIKLNQLGNTIIMVTHDEKYAQMSTRKIVISDGALV